MIVNSIFIVDIPPVYMMTRVYEFNRGFFLIMIDSSILFDNTSDIKMQRVIFDVLHKLLTYMYPVIHSWLINQLI